MIELRAYLTADERAPFDDWLAALRDGQARGPNQSEAGTGAGRQLR